MEHTQEILRPDNRGRITLGKLAEGISGYKLSKDKQGKITLEPLAEIPAYEIWLYKNKGALKGVLEGIDQAKAGKGKYLGSFAQYAEDEIE